MQLDAPGGEHGHERAQVGDVRHDVGGKDHDHILADLGEEVQEAVALLRVEAGRGLVDDDEARIAEQSLGHAEALAHAARKARQRLFADAPQIDLMKQGLDRGLALGRAGDALQHRHVIQHVAGGNAGIDSEILREVAERAPELIGMGEDVDVAEADAALGRDLQRRHRAHQGRLARAVRPEEAVHAARNGQGHVVQRAGAVRVDVADAVQIEHPNPP